MRKWIFVVGAVAVSALALAACEGPAATDETFEVVQGQDTFQGTGRLALLGKDAATYLADRAYLRKLAPDGQAIEINHADPRQHRFAVARLRMAGKTPENSPALFQAMSELVTAHARRGLAAGTVVPMAAAGSLQSQHEMLSLGKVTRTSTTVSTSSLASRKDRLTHGFVDCNAYDGDGNAIGDSQYVEVFGDMRFFAPRCQGDMTWAATNSAQGDSFLSETVSGTGVTRQSYVLGPVVRFDALAAVLGTPTVNQPSDLNADNKISVCLDRLWTGDCDVNNTGFATLKLPLKGSVAITNGTFDWATIAHYQTDRPDTFSRIFVTLVTSGGGCVLPPGGATFSITDFWKQVSGSGGQLSWDLFTDPTKWPQFSPTCRLVQDRVDLTMQLRLPYQSPETSGTIALEITTVGTPAPPNFKIPFPIQVTNSCLAAGTLIETASHAATKIEELRIGDRVASPHAAGLTVTDTATGTERSPMVRIASANGRELLMTETHPLVVIGRGMVPAKVLKVGDRVSTVDGPSELVRVTRESYSGRVYNLKVGNAEEAAALGVDGTAVFANGFLVGDGQVQSRHEVIEMHQATPTRIPAGWKADYLASVQRAAATP